MRLISLTFLLFPLLSFSQNLNFEKINAKSNMPIGWLTQGNKTASVDSMIIRSGRYSLCFNGGVNSFVFSPNNKLSYTGDSISLTGYTLRHKFEGQVEVKFNLGENVSVKSYFIGKNITLFGNNNNEWEKFVIKLPLCQEANYYEIQILVNGNGYVWFDDFNVDIDGKQLDKSKLKTTTPSYKALNDINRNNSDFIVDRPFTESEIDNIVILCKVWGFLKYYHPAITQGNYNWDYELFKILPKIYNLNSASRNKLLYEWLESLGKYATVNQSINSNDDTHLTPNFSWINELNMGDKFSKKLNSVIYAKRSPYNYYVSPFLSVGNVFFNREEAYPTMDYNDMGIKLLGIYRLWNAVNYFYPYIEHVSNWDKVLKDAICNIMNSKNALDYQLIITKMLYALNDTHAMVSDDNQTIDYSRGIYSTPITVRYIENCYVVTSVLRKGVELEVGDAITHVNGKSVNDYIDSVKYYISASNFSSLTRDISKIINLSTNKNSINYKFTRNGENMEKNIQTYSGQEIMDSLIGYKYPISNRIINDSIAYINIETIDGKTINSIYNDYYKYNHLILDMRGYPEVLLNQYFSLLLPQNVAFAKRTIADVSMPGRFVMKDSDRLGGDKKDISNREREIYVLVNEETQSASEYLTMMLQSIPNTLVVGSQTAGADGNVVRLTMPGGFKVEFSGIGVYYPDGGETQRVGVRIDETVKPTIKGIREGRDEVLERAIEIINSK